MVYSKHLVIYWLLNFFVKETKKNGHLTNMYIYTCIFNDWYVYLMLTVIYQIDTYMNYHYLLGYIVFMWVFVLLCNAIIDFMIFTVYFIYSSLSMWNNICVNTPVFVWCEGEFMKHCQLKCVVFTTDLNHSNIWDLHFLCYLHVFLRK